MVNLAIIYAACVAGAIGLIVALPRRHSRLSLLGAIIAAGALGAAFLALVPAMTPGTDPVTVEGDGAATSPGFFFYFLAFIAAGGALRMITHPRPVYAALYFILVVLAGAGLILLLAAEFMAFALIIVYAGAILVTYLFVIMLAQETPDEGDWSALMDYDANAREPLAAVLAGFLLLAVLLGVGYRGIQSDEIPWNGEHTTLAALTEDAKLELLPNKIERALIRSEAVPRSARLHDFDLETRTAQFTLESGEIQSVPIPDDLRPANIESIGLSLFIDFPVSLELAGIILFMAMLGAVVLARKPSKIDEVRRSQDGSTNAVQRAEG